MSVKCSEIIKLMEKYAPAYLAEDWDNVGLMVGESDAEVSRILVALDATDAVVEEAIEKKADIIVTHHPFLFRAIKNVTDGTPVGNRIIKLIRNNISVFSAHTNLDSAQGGTNDTLAHLIGLEAIEGLADIHEEENAAMGRIGTLEKEMSFGELVERVKSAIGADRLSVCGDTDRIIKRVGICTGKGASYMAEAKAKGANVFITGDFGYHEGQTAQELDLCVIDGTHYLTEVIVVPVICEYLKNNITGVEVIASEVNGQTLTII
jgi:dinuclear metal center YbgI/SA1388 family protein